MTGQYQRICIVFLDSDLTLHGKISADTGDAQACVQPPSREDGCLDILNSCWVSPIFGGSLIQASPPDAIFSYSRDPLRVEAAVGAGVALRDLHTAKTTIEFHLPLSFLSGLAFGSVVCGCAVCDNFEKILPGTKTKSVGQMPQSVSDFCIPKESYCPSIGGLSVCCSRRRSHPFPFHGKP